MHPEPWAKSHSLPWLVIWVHAPSTFPYLQEVSACDLAPKSLLFLDKESWIRKPLIRFIRWKVFDWFMLSCILANCVTLAMASNKPGFEQSSLGKSLKLSNYVFVGLFGFEATCKIIALGFLFARHTYLRSGGNYYSMNSHSCSVVAPD